jgi:hypothetical protein
VIHILLYVLVALVGVELFHRLPIISLLKSLLIILKNSKGVISSRKISDHWKQKAILAYAGMMAVTTLKFGGLFLVILFVIYVITVGFDFAIKANVPHAELLMTPIGLIAITILAIVYFFLRRHLEKLFVKQSDYSFFERFLHYLALGMPGSAEISFSVNCAINKPTIDVFDKRHVFIAGLARAGTTILMRTFYETGCFRSLTYRDMPFILMPNIWKSISTPFRQEKELEERAHGDRVMVNYDSPEALEEVFWRTFCGDEYIFDKCLKPHNPNDNIINRFRCYISVVISSGDANQTYLSKNNNNILRLHSIQKAFPNALIIVPFRDPIQQAMSLKRQHERFCIRHNTDKFSLRYMTWLGHHEFGSNHKPFVFSENIDSNLNRWSTDDIHYWINLWTQTYSYILDKQTDNTVFVGYETLCHKPIEILSQLFKTAKVEFSLGDTGFDFSPSITASPESISDKIFENATDTYASLRERMIKIT